MYNTEIHQKYIHLVHFDQNLFVKMKSRQATLQIITGMEVPVTIFFESVKLPSDKSLICTFINGSTNYQITQYYHVIDNYGFCKFLLNLLERVTSIMTSLGNILKEDLENHTFCLECFTGDAYE